MTNLARIARVMRSKRIRHISLAVALALGALNCAEAATIRSASAALGDVSAAIASASEGDTVVVPAGTATWTTTLTITKAITLQGATTVSGDHNTQLAGTPMSANDQTVIVNNIAKNVSGDNRLIMAQLSSNTTPFRMTGFTFRQGTTGAGNNGEIVASGGTWPYPNVRIDHCHNSLQGQAIHFYDCFGVVDHNIFECAGSTQPAFVGMSSYGGGSNGWGDGSWADGPNFGTNKFIFFEDNTINNSGGQNAGLIDATPGGRYVQRYNVLNGSLMGGGHGTETIERGVRAAEYYGNVIYPTTKTNSGGWGGMLRSGTLLSYNNTWITSNSDLVGGKVLQVFRDIWDYPPWGGGTANVGATGANAWDINDTEGNGSYVAGHAPLLYASGTHTGASGATTLTDSTKNWATNKWQPPTTANGGTFQIINKTQNHHAAILSNTNNTITYTVYTDQGGPLKFNAGDSYQIHLLLVPLNGVGRGKGDLVRRVNGQPQNTSTGTASWTHDALEPCYCWDSHNGQAVKLRSQAGQGTTIQENRDHYDLNTSWQPGQALTTGIAVGTLANRPSQCTAGRDFVIGAAAPGVAYWATDTGPANQNGSVSGTLYVCTSTNTWTPYYTPYQYPHSLVSGASSGPTPPSAPQNLHVVGP